MTKSSRTISMISRNLHKDIKSQLLNKECLLTVETLTLKIILKLVLKNRILIKPMILTHLQQT